MKTASEPVTIDEIENLLAIIDNLHYRVSRRNSGIEDFDAIDRMGSHTSTELLTLMRRAAESLHDHAQYYMRLPRAAKAKP